MTHWRQQDRCICPWCYVQAKLHSSVWSKSREDSPNLDKIDYLSSFVGGHRVVLEFVDADLLRPLTISISTYIRFAMSQECDSERWWCGVTRSNWRRLHIQVNFMCGLRPKLTSCRLLEAYMILYTQSWYIWWADNDPYPQLITQMEVTTGYEMAYRNTLSGWVRILQAHPICEKWSVIFCAGYVSKTKDEHLLDTGGGARTKEYDKKWRLAGWICSF